MKTLKFMLAAATAIGLASATQANEFNTTGFEKLAVGTSVTTGVEDNRDGYSYFYYAGSVAEDNESVIAEGTPNIARPRGAAAVDAGREKILQVSTGTDPLMRTYAPVGGGQPQSTTISGDTYVDTLVQFTVTPYTDTVTPGANDKLMVYLGENTNDVGEVTSKSLKVIAGYIGSNSQVSAKEYEVANVSVDTNTWYRLTVKTIPDISVDDQGESSNNGHFMGFQIFINGTLCTLNEKAYDDDETSGAWDLVEYSIYYTAIDNKQMVPSILATSNDENKSSKLQGVGFAGEGKVDDIVFSELDPFATVFDFTFTAWDEKVDSVSYTVGAASYIQAGTYEVEAGTKFKINSISYASGWQEGSFTVVGLADPDQDGYYTVTNNATFTIVPAQAATEDWVEDPTQIADNTPAATQYPSLAGTALATADAKKLTVWAKANNVTFNSATEDAADYVEAFLLNCAPVPATVAAEKEAFVLDISVAADGTVTVSLPAGKSYNGTLQMKGSADLTTWTDVSATSSTYKFYKYELSL